MIKNLPLFTVPIIVGALIQLIKLFLDLYQKRKRTIQILRAAWGFPSVHSWLSSSIATLMALTQWLQSPEFAISFTFAFLFWYDAMNIRYEAGKHASYINDIRSELQTVLDLDNKYNYLKERLGHTPIEVLWGIIMGIALTVILYDLILQK